MDNLIIRPGTVADAPIVGALVMDLMPYLTLDPQGRGAEAFIANVGVAAQARYLAAPDFRYRLALDGDTLAGFVALRDNSHVYHLFVARALHGQGLGRRLWQLARDEALALGNPGVFTVNASDYGLPMYLRLGFVPVAPREEKDGIAWTRMRYG